MGKINCLKRCVLITGTVVPNSVFVAHANVEDRLEEYYQSLLFYADLFLNEDIYFLENSSYDFSGDDRFQKLLKDREITLLKFPVSTQFYLGKGYQEFQMLDEAIGKLCRTYDCFVKITGRYRVINLKEILPGTCETLIADHHKQPGVTQTNVFYVNGGFYNSYLKGLYAQVDDSNGIYIEKLIYQKLVTEHVLQNTHLFKTNPIIKGISGSYGGTLSRNKYKLRLRNIERSLLRILGIKQFLIEY